ncbi:MAG: hypothetical protein IMZ63_01655, partial [Actinobacteria bacterium]|nr:hypothetical protein [Actinomycetota bacterium]
YIQNKHLYTNTCLPAGRLRCSAPLTFSANIYLQIPACRQAGYGAPHLLVPNTMQQTYKIFVEIYLKNNTTSAKHSASFTFTTNIYLQIPACRQAGYDAPHLLVPNTKRQSRIIFVEMYLKNKTIGAEHRNI